MPLNKPQFKFPSDIKLVDNSLIEAWLEIRWQLETVAGTDFARDSGYPFALGAFYQNVKSRFGYKEDLEASFIPEEMLPYVVRHRFREGKDKWPLIQLGPGVASVNFTTPYSWNMFQEEALFLRKALLEAYTENELKVNAVYLRYRNGVPFNFTSENLLDFCRTHLNTTVTLPSTIPGQIGRISWPKDINLKLTYDLTRPKGTGSLQIATGHATKQPITEILTWQIEVATDGTNVPRVADEQEFNEWLFLAHAAIHEWYFSLIEGPLLEKYLDGEG